MKLTQKNLKKIRVGNKVKFTYPNGSIKVGVVYGIPAEGNWGILCNASDNQYFGVGIFDGTISFEIEPHV